MSAVSARGNSGRPYRKHYNANTNSWYIPRRYRPPKVWAKSRSIYEPRLYTKHTPWTDLFCARSTIWQSETWLSYLLPQILRYARLKGCWRDNGSCCVNGNVRQWILIYPCVQHIVQHASFTMKWMPCELPAKYFVLDHVGESRINTLWVHSLPLLPASYMHRAEC